MGPLTPYNTSFLLHNHLVWSKIGCLQKTRGQKVKIWGIGGDFRKKQFFRVLESMKKIVFQQTLTATFLKL